MGSLWQTVMSQMSPVEIVAAIATLINVYLTAKNNIWCWPWGIVSVVLYGFVFYESHLYSSMGLQALYYLPMQFYGWWVWLRCGPKQDDDLPIAKLSFRGLLFWFGINQCINISSIKKDGCEISRHSRHYLLNCYEHIDRGAPPSLQLLYRWLSQAAS